MQDSTTLRVSRRTQETLAELAAAEGRSIADLVEHLAEQARRHHILDQSAARMAELMADPTEREAYLQELRRSEDEAASVVDA